MPEPMTCRKLDEALYSLRIRASKAIKDLREAVNVAPMFVREANAAVLFLERAIELTQPPGYENNWDARNELVGCYNKVRDRLGLMQKVQAYCLKAAEEHDHTIAPLRNEALALIGIVAAIEPDGRVLSEKQAVLAKKIQEFNEAAATSFLGSLDTNLAHQRGELVEAEERLRLGDFARKVVPLLEPVANELSALDRVAQLQRGTWQLIGNAVASIAAAHGNGTGEAVIKWSLSRTSPRAQLLQVRDAAARAENYIRTSEPLHAIPV